MATPALTFPKELKTKEGQLEDFKVVRKALCHARFGYDAVLPCWHQCRYCYALYIHDTLRELKKKYGEDTDVVLFKDLPQKLGEALKTLVDAEFVYPMRYGIFSDVSPPYRESSRIMAEALRVHKEYNYPLYIFTKVPLHRLMPDALLNAAEVLHVSVTITTLREDIARWIEPYAPSPKMRLEFLQWLEDHGIPTTTRITPLLQGVTDSPEHVEEILSQTPSRHIVVEYLRIGSTKHEESPKEALAKFCAGLGLSMKEVRVGGRTKVVCTDGRRSMEFVYTWGRTSEGASTPFYQADPAYQKSKFMELRDLIHKHGKTFAVCGHYAGFKIQDTADCCAGERSLFEKLKNSWNFKKLYAARLPKAAARFKDYVFHRGDHRDKGIIYTPIMMWQTPDEDLYAKWRILLNIGYHEQKLKELLA